MNQLARVIYSKAIGAVVLNRLASSDFPDTLVSVYQASRFCCDRQRMLFG
ncbi:cell wall hydrolase [Paenibacillus sp. A3M_27_13]|nr:cell wall hydrolase [Paenibacillus sp. A3M_27_13]MCP3746738.1 cell wall hydrolase [Paenibacillus sp. A3M_27_13]